MKAVCAAGTAKTYERKVIVRPARGSMCTVQYGMPPMAHRISGRNREYKEDDMAKVIVAKQKYDVPHLLGQFLDERHYDTLIEDDCDVYAPPDCDLGTQADCDHQCDSCANGHDERKIIFKFRKNFFTKEEQDAAYHGLRDAASVSQNRGVAAGPRELEGRNWVTDYEHDVIEYFSDPKTNLMGVDPIDEIKSTYVKTPPQTSNKHNIWLADPVKADNFDFESWVATVRVLPPNEQKREAAKMVKKYISQTSYANGVASGIAGWFDRYPRTPYGRATSYTTHHFEKFAMAYPFLQHLAKGFKELLPWRYGNQEAAAKRIDPGFLVPGTPFTTITVNKTFRTAAHYDAGDLNTGLSNLLVLSNTGNYSGGFLVAPEYRVAVNVRPGDLLLINNHEVMHGNTPIVLNDKIAERVSLVCYFRENMLQLGSKTYEDCRRDYVEERRLDKTHPGHKDRNLWNGVSVGMWEDQTWYDYCEARIGRAEFLKMHPEAEKGPSLF